MADVTRTSLSLRARTRHVIRRHALININSVSSLEKAATRNRSQYIYVVMKSIPFSGRMKLKCETLDLTNEVQSFGPACTSTLPGNPVPA
jgi:hypothetical protein